ncbi:enduracididine biosynthesis enzyme MppP [Streptomyces sp. NPDC053513]|uniref:Enduracididine biosynthesis enzyme MppP n=1 Tax=Streptomyces litmocidini TaxID=67318 RepID=A0ABW7UHC7_9ACTN|nr:enduracididine biosynthesis enzyme MppP [Streptomyces sp. PanSC19]ROQ34848.1 enduracididine biosynthesis enzyme MppP [Streptomyces sp. PanSC19]
MNRILPKVSAENLTQFETLALASPMNLADGHARQHLTAAQGKIVSELPDLWAEAVLRPVDEIEREAAESFFGMLGQHGHPFAAGRTLSCYSSSVAMEILARSLVTTTDAVALIHPTFDNIPDILRGVGLRLVPVEEDRAHDEDLPAELLEEVGCVFITTPNNPTGRVMSEDRLRRLAGQCAEHGVVLALDTSFRGFDPAAQFDHYAVLDASGCRWVVIEDTGKLWPTLELKIGWLVRSAEVDLPIEKIHSDILLGTSPLVLLLVKRFADDGADGGLAELQRTIADHRALVRAALDGVPDVSFVDEHARVSVERLHVGSRLGMDVWSAVRSRSLYVLPCQKFHWARPQEGERMLRLALSRDPSTLLASARVLRSALLDTAELQG